MLAFTKIWACHIGSGKLTYIAITGSNVTIVCNNSGSVYCELCDNVMIEGITWDRCGNLNGTNVVHIAIGMTLKWYKQHLTSELCI